MDPSFKETAAYFFLTEIDIKLVAHSPYVFVKLLPKKSFMDLKNVSPTIMAYCTTLFLISELTSSQKKCHNGPMHFTFTGNITFPTI